MSGLIKYIPDKIFKIPDKGALYTETGITKSGEKIFREWYKALTGNIKITPIKVKIGKNLK